MNNKRIEPRVLKGFRDQLPQIAIPREAMLQTIREVFNSFGFVPIDTPALEYSEILLGKGSDETDKQMYRFEDNGGRDISLRFDLTVPLARFAAMHINELGTPFKRYHVAPVWRAEKPQRGRYREFMQCDVDIIGTRSLVADSEIVAIINRTLQALGIKNTIRLNNRKLLNGLLEKLNARAQSTAVLRAIDKLEKLGADIVSKELETEAGLNQNGINDIFTFLDLSKNSIKSSELLTELKKFFAGNLLGLEGVSDLETIITNTQALDIDDNACSIDLSIARGLDYYTGTIFETKLTELPEIGSICSGGRYDNLANLYTKKELPGVGTSFGLDRILAALEELGKLSGKSSTASVLVTLLDQETQAQCLALADNLRATGLAVELYTEVAKLANQLKYANKKGIEYVIIAGAKELADGVCNVKELATGEQKEAVALSDVSKLLTEVPW